jgi:histidinol-phosphate aminotransferase
MSTAIIPDWVIREDVRHTSAYPVTPATGMVKLDAMENPYTLPESLRQALAARLATVDLNRYPDPTAPQLRQQLRQVMDIPERHGLLLGNGSDEIIQIAIQAVAREGATVMAIEPSFVMYRISARHARVNFVGVDLKPDFSLDEPATLAAMREHRPAIVLSLTPTTPAAICMTPRLSPALFGLRPDWWWWTRPIRCLPEPVFFNGWTSFPT